MSVPLLSKYLNRHAEPVSKHACDAIADKLKSYTHAIVVPVYDELDNTLNLIKQLTDLRIYGNLIVVLVINHHEKALQQGVRANQKLYHKLCHRYPLTAAYNDTFKVLAVHQAIDMAVFYHHGNNHLPAKCGVGLARKIGCDFALNLMEKQNHHFWLHNTDADVILPVDYFCQAHPYSVHDYSACLYTFKHTVADQNQKIYQAISRYEQAMHNYVSGLRLAGSPYAYHTLGSILAVSPVYYVKAHGFPKLDAAEDFYLLNKLAKIKPPYQLKGDPIQIQARLSERVPFGTGPALKRIINNDTSFIQSLEYSKQCFMVLALVIDHINQNAAMALKKYPETAAVLDQLGFFQALDKISTNTIHSSTRIQQIHQWFDALKTLKFIRLLNKKGQQSHSPSTIN